MPKLTQQFQTIRTEGALLPSDILQRIASLKVDGIRPADYHLPEGFRVNEAVTQSWDILKKHWKNFKAARENLAATDHGTALTNERWLLPLFKELEYGRLSTVTAPQIEDRIYPIERFYNHTPIHLIGCNLPLDKRTKGARGAATSSPHSTMQEFLNRSDTYLWGFLSNGLQLRVQRDSVALSRQAFVEFDLEGMMDGEVYGDFVLMWLLCHQSRVESERPENCWLEQWSKLAREEGTRVLNNLRTGVTKAIEALGQGFIAHPQNDELRSKLQESGSLTKDDFYRQLLRTVYRLLFLFVAEDRELLHPPEASEQACKLYETYYSTRRLREMAFKLRGSKHSDLWYSLSLVFGALNRDHGLPELGLPGLGSFLWENKSTPDILGPGQINESPLATAENNEHQREVGGLQPAFIANDDLFAAIRAIAYVEQDKVLRSVDYRNMGTEEFGSVYESLLELHPVMQVEAKAFSLNTAAGNERKTSGSYYTPDSLVQCLLDSALEPVIEERLKGKKGKDAEETLLSIKVCDPACGSGHFLISAAHRLARHLARIRTGESEPSPEDYQHALRDVIGRCLYGVDINPMAVELCKVSLWMEALEPGKPLSFLDHHVQCGNSLLGATPALLKSGIPDGAFTAIEGDVKKICTVMKKDHQGQRKDRQRGMKGFAFEKPIEAAHFLQTMIEINSTTDATIEGVKRKEILSAQFFSSEAWKNARFWADYWCGAFVWKKDESDIAKHCPMERDFRRIERDGRICLLPDVRSEVDRLRDYYKFFHWHLAFPDVFHLPTKDEEPDNERAGWTGGFDLMLGNPPWDTLSPDAKEFFSYYDPQVRFQDQDGQRRIIEALLLDSTISKRWTAHCRDLYGLVHFIKESGRFQMFAPGNLGKGDFNVYRMFVETALSLARHDGWASQLVPEGLYNGANCMAIRQALFEQCRLECLYGFVNTNEAWFPNVHTAMKFCLYAAHLGGRSDSFRAAFNTSSLLELALVKTGEFLNIPVGLVKEFSPDAFAIMELGSQMDIDIAAKMYHWPPFGDDISGTPRRVYMAELHMGNDRDLFDEDPAGIPLYEGRMVDQFDYRAKGYRSGRGRAAIWEDLPFGTSMKSIQSQWHIARTKIPEKCVARMDSYRIGFCDVASPTNERTLVGALLPPNTNCGDKVPTITFQVDSSGWQLMLWLSVANSYAMDFVARKKVSLKMSYTVVDSLPFPRLDRSDSRSRELVPRALRLSCTGPEMNPFWNQLAAEGWVPANTVPTQVAGENDESRRLQLRAEIDAIVARDLFELTRAELEYILTTFPTQQRYQEEKYGEFRSRRLILNAFDRVTNELLLEFERVAAYVVLFLRECKRPAARNVVEAELVLMLNDAARQQILNQSAAKASRKAITNTTDFVRGFDGFLNQLVAMDFIVVEVVRGIQTIRLGTRAPDTDSAPAEDRARLHESLKALEIVGEDRARDLLMEMVNERYAFVS